MTLLLNLNLQARWGWRVPIASHFGCVVSLA